MQLTEKILKKMYNDTQEVLLKFLIKYHSKVLSEIQFSLFKPFHEFYPNNHWYRYYDGILSDDVCTEVRYG